MIMLAAAILLFVGVPLLAVTVIPPAAGMMFFILTLLILNPIFFTISGITAANNVKNRWLFPLISFAGILEMTEPFYLLLYLIFGYGEMAIKLVAENMPKRSKQAK